jgi:hypothetical protein
VFPAGGVLILKLFDRRQRVQDAAVQSNTFKTRRMRASHHVGMAPAISTGYPWSGLMVRDWQAGRAQTTATNAVSPPTVSVTESTTGW